MYFTGAQCFSPTCSLLTFIVSFVLVSTEGGGRVEGAEWWGGGATGEAG